MKRTIILIVSVIVLAALAVAPVGAKGFEHGIIINVDGVN